LHRLTSIQSAIYTLNNYWLCDCSTASLILRRPWFHRLWYTRCVNPRYPGYSRRG